MPHSAASDLSLHCLPVSLLWGTRHIWVKYSEWQAPLKAALKSSKKNNLVTKGHSYEAMPSQCTGRRDEEQGQNKIVTAQLK